MTRGVMLPRAVLLDMDDTILDDTGGVHPSWREACRTHVPELGAGADPEIVRTTILRVSRWYWEDAERHRTGRLALNEARREVVRLAFEELGYDAPTVALRIADTYSARRDEGLEVFAEAIDTIAWLRASGCRLALLTNGNGDAQREKIARFDLARWFEHILIEGEMGYGKPDERVYRLALDRLGVTAADTWMVGDNLEWDVAAPQRLGIYGIWIDHRGEGVPADQSARPDRMIRTLAELRR